MDDDLGLMPEADRKGAKQGRRAQQPQQQKPQPSRQGDLDGSILEKSQERRNRHAGGGERGKLAASLLEDEDDDEKPKRSHAEKPGGKPKSTWDVDPNNGGRAEDAYEDERLMAKAGKQAQSDDESDADIPQIPELEDTKDAVAGEADGGVVSISPGVVTKVATYRELEDDLMKHLPFLTLDQEVDLKPLTKFLIPETLTIEPDVGWEWETLYAEVASELMKEIETLQHLNLDQGDTQLAGISAL